MNSIRVFQNPETLANELAICWHEQAKEAAKNHNWFSVVLSGGNTAPLLYGKLAEPKWKNCIPWSCVHIFFADERCVPPYNKESNYKNIYDTLLRNIPIPDENIHRIKGEEDPEKEALRYSKEIQYHLNIKKAKNLKLFLTLLKRNLYHILTFAPSRKMISHSLPPKMTVLSPCLRVNRACNPSIVPHSGYKFVVIAGSVPERFPPS